MTIIVCQSKDGQTYSAILRARDVDRWLAERTEAMSILGIVDVTRVELTPADIA